MEEAWGWGQDSWLLSPSFAPKGGELLLSLGLHMSLRRETVDLPSILSPPLPCGFSLPQVLKVYLASLARTAPVVFQAHLESWAILVSLDYKDLQDLKVR